MANRKLTRKQILAGFGGRRRQQLLKPGPAKRRYASRSSGVKRRSASRSSGVKRYGVRRSSGVKRSSVKSRLAKVGVLAGVTAAAAAAGVGLKTYVDNSGGLQAILDSLKAGFGIGGVSGAIAGGLGVLAAPAMTGGTTAPITPAQAEQLFQSPVYHVPELPGGGPIYPAELARTGAEMESYFNA